MTNDKPKHRQEGEDRSAFQIGDKPGEGGQRDIQDELRDHDELQEQEEFTGMAATGEQSFAKDGQGATKR
jgi:hypothetical protein